MVPPVFYDFDRKISNTPGGRVVSGSSFSKLRVIGRFVKLAPAYGCDSVLSEKFLRKLMLKKLGYLKK